MANQNRPQDGARRNVAPAPSVSPSPAPADELVALRDRVAELELALEVARNDLAAKDAEVAELRTTLEGLQSENGQRIPIVKKYTLRFRGKDYEDGEVFPFDPRKPPHDAPGPYIEGLQFYWRTMQSAA